MGSLYVATGKFDPAVAGPAMPVPTPLEYAIHAVHNNNNDLEITISWTLWYNFNLTTQVLVATALISCDLVQHLVCIPIVEILIDNSIFLTLDNTNKI